MDNYKNVFTIVYMFYFGLDDKFLKVGCCFKY